MNPFVVPGVSLPVSGLTLGTATFGSDIPGDAAEGLMDAFAEAGGTLIDTAHVYAAWRPGGAGASERCIGGWVARRGVRDRVLIGTKGGHPALETMDRSRLRPEDLASDLAESLERLRTDYVDIYWVHRDDPEIPAGEIMDALEALREKGQARAIGASNWPVTRLEEAEAYARGRGYRGFCASEIEWSLAPSEIPEAAGKGTVAMDEATLRYHGGTGLPVVAYSAQARGFFSRPGRKIPGRNTLLNEARRARAFALAERHGCSANAIALAWLMQAPFPVSAIAGPRTLRQLSDSLAATKVVLTEAEKNSLTCGMGCPGSAR